MISNIWSVYFEKFLDLVFQRYCLICSVSITHDFFCHHCNQSLIVASTIMHCRYCGVKLSTENICVTCLNDRAFFTEAYSVYAYDDNVSKLINRFKFFDSTYLAKSFALMMYNNFATTIKNVDVLMPVPIHRVRLFRRKYNQAALISRFISQYSNIASDYFSLKRIKNTEHQSFRKKIGIEY